MKIAIIGASKDQEKYSNKAIKAYRDNHHTVFPVNPNEREIEGLKCYSSISEIPFDIEIASFYVPSEIGLKIADEISKRGIKKVYLNPGADDSELHFKLSESGIEVIRSCCIKDVGIDPKKII